LAEPPITLLTGHWSSNLTSNFVLTFAGNPKPELVYKFEKAILATHFDYSFQLAPNYGYTKLAVFGVPCLRDQHGNLPPSDHLRVELGKNLAIKGSQLIDGPTWSYAARFDSTLTTACVHFVIHDPSGCKTAQITKARNCAYGRPVSIRVAAPSRAYMHCLRCHALTHNIDKCPRPPSYKRCGFCGKRDHVSSSHCTIVCGGAHNSVDCKCPPKCFNCRAAGKPDDGHWAIDSTCPLKKNMCRDPPHGTQQTSSTVPPTAPQSNTQKPAPVTSTAMPRIDNL
jgi:hypothetical protein